MTENRKNGMCPMMSKAVLKPELASNIVNLPGQSAQVVETIILTVSCPGEQCQLWDGYQNMCSIKSSPGVVGAIDKGLERSRADMIQGATMAQLTESVRNIGNTLTELTRVLAIPAKK